MIYHCDRCGAALPAGVLACPTCGKKFDNPVPTDAEVPDAPFADLLRGRTVGGPPKPSSVASDSASPPDALPPPPSAVPPNQGLGRNMWLLSGAGLVLFLALCVWGISALWRQGPGGEIAFRQHNRAGNAAVERGDYGTADDEYGQMIALRPRRVDGYLLRAISEDKAGLYTASIDDDTAALPLAKDPMMCGDLLYNRGEARANRGDLSGAIADYTRSGGQYLLVHDPQLLPYVQDRREDCDRDRAQAYWQHKDYAPAIADCDAVIAFGHPRPDDYGVRAKAKAALGQGAAASVDFNQALRLDPSYLDGYAGLGGIAEKAHDYRQAVAVYERATRAEPENGMLWGGLGWFQYEAGQNADAIISDQRSQSLTPNQAWVDYNLALTYAAAGQGPQAQAAYADALSYGGNDARRAALTDIRTALTRQPASATLRQALAQVEKGPLMTGHVRPMVPARPRMAVAALPPPKPPAAFASALSPEVALAGYGIQPPRGYTLTQKPEVTLSSSGTDSLWTGPRRSDGTAPTLEVVIAEDGGQLAAHETSRQVTQEALAGMGENHTSLVPSPVTDCAVGGMPFAQGEWAGVGVITGKAYRGDEYWMVSPSHILHLSTHDADAYSHTTGPLLRASVFTFRRM